MRTLLALLCGMACCSSGVLADSEKKLYKPFPDAPIASQVRNLPMMSADKRLELMNALERDVQIAEHHLIKQLRKPVSDEHEAFLMAVVGRYRFESAAELLAKRLTFAMPRISHSHIPLWGDYPALHPLTQIGTASVPPVLKQIEESKDDLTIRHGAMVIETIYTPKIARLVIEDSIAAQPNPEKKNRLEQAKAAIKKS